MKYALLLSLLLGACQPAASQDPGGGRFRVDVWADNWFSLHLGETLVKEDSVPITTERSFNKETFSFDGSYPLTLNFILKDFKQDDSGLEYIGTASQQMGDGGFIAQITDTASGKVVGASGAAWRCLVIHRAPLNVSCEKDPKPAQTCMSMIAAEPPDWKRADFNTSAWEAATVYTEAQVGPKDGYTQVAWDAAAKLIWTASLKQDNTLLCKTTITGS